MKQDFVVCKGKKYNSGDKMYVIWCGGGRKLPQNYTATFVSCDEEKDEYTFIVDNLTFTFSKELFWKTVVSEPVQTGYKKMQPRKATVQDELNITNLFFAWMWYIFIMVVSIIFNDRIGIWILASIIFFSYRKNKLREAGYK